MKEKFSKKIKLTENERKKYPLPEEEDYEILFKCKQLEKMKLTKEDKLLVELIKSQLEIDWHKPLIKKLNQLLKKYQPSRNFK